MLVFIVRVTSSSVGIDDPVSLLTTLCRISLDNLIQFSSFTYVTPTILRLFFLEKRSSSFSLFVCDWIVDSSIVNLSCMEEQVCCKVCFQLEIYEIIS